MVENGICNATTNYGYDVLGNLSSVAHANYGTLPCSALPAAQIESRSFVYDSLGRLQTAVNPESGTIGYSYDNNGNLVKRTDGRGAIACYGVLNGASCDGTGYDALNPMTKKSYSDNPTCLSGTGTPCATYNYSGTNGFSFFGFVVGFDLQLCELRCTRATVVYPTGVDAVTDLTVRKDGGRPQCEYASPTAELQKPAKTQAESNVLDTQELRLRNRRGRQAEALASHVPQALSTLRSLAPTCTGGR